MDSSLTINSSKTKLLVGLAFLLVFAIAYFDSLRILFGLWAGTEQTIYRYGFLVLACTCYLIYLKRSKFVNLSAEPVPWLLFLGLLLSGIWCIASIAGVQTVQLAILPFLVLTTITTFFGIRHLRLLFIPVILLLYAIPLWWPLVPFMKDAATLVTEIFLRTIGKPVFVEGYFLHLPGGTFFIDDGCAGLRFLLVTLILGFMSIDLYSLSLRQSVLLLSTSVILALLANWVRVIAIVLVGDYTQMQHRLVSDHNDLGWAIYGVLVLIPFFLLIKHISLEKPTSLSKYPAENSNQRTAESTAENSSPSRIRKRFIALFLLTVCILASGPAVSLLIKYQTYPARQIVLPESSASWNKLDLTEASAGSDWRPNYVDANDFYFSRYVSNGLEVELQIVNYANQQEGAELINVDNSITDDEIWFIVPDSEHPMKVSNEYGFSLDLIEAEIQSRNRERKLIWYWYEVGRFSTNNIYLAKIYQLLALLDRRQDANLVVIAIDCVASCERNKPAIKQFLVDTYPSIKSGMQ